MKLIKTPFSRDGKLWIRLAASWAWAFAATMGASAANLSYTPQGSAPYYWSDGGNWPGGTKPGSGDTAILNDAALSTSPVVIDEDVFVTGVTVGTDGTSGHNLLLINSGVSLTMPEGTDPGLAIGGDIGVVTNYGTVSGRINIGRGSSGKGTIARFDNFGTVKPSVFRMGYVDAGTPTVFHNHVGATFTLTPLSSANGYNFYIAQRGSKSDSIFINEGTMSNTSKSQLWLGLKVGGRSELRIIGNGTFTANGEIRLGYNSTTADSFVYLTDHGQITGTGAINIGEGSASATDCMVLSNNASIVKASGTISIGHRANAKGELQMHDSSSVSNGTSSLLIGATSPSTGTLTMDGDSRLRLGSGAIRLGYASSSIGTIAMDGNSSVELGTGSLYLGDASSSTGAAIMGGNSCLKVGYALLIGAASNSVGTVTMTNSATAVIKDYVHIGSGIDSTGTLTLTNSATMDMQYYVYLGVDAGAKGIVSLAGDSALYVTNSSVIVGYNGGGTGVLNVAENAQLHANNLFVGQTSVAGTTGFVKLSDTATLFSTNIAVPRWGGQGIGTLEVGGNSVVTNVHDLRIAYAADSTTGVGQSGTVAMRGGSIYFDIDPENPSYIKNGRYNPINLNGYVSTVKGRIRGWGKIAFADPRTYVTEAKVPSGITHYGQVIADGEGVMRDLDFGRFGSLQYTTTDANPSGTNGWFAVNKGRLKLPRSLPNRSGYKCVGDCFSANVDLGGTSRRLANIFNYEFTGAELNNFVFSELYAIDRDDIPAGLNNIGADKVIAVWRIGYFSDGPEIDEPTHPVSFTSAKLKFKYSPEGLAGLNFVHVYRHDGTANGKWERCGKLTAPSTSMPVVSSRTFAPSSENWNLGWFAIVGRVEKPCGMVFTIR